MATQPRWFPVFLDTRVAALACDNVALASSTAHTFGAVTINVPELTRTFRSCTLHLFAYPATTGAVVLGHWSVVPTWNGGAPSATISSTPVSGGIPLYTGGEHEFLIDLTDEFIANFGSGSSASLVLAVKFVLSTLGNVVGVGGYIEIQVDVDDEAETVGGYACFPMDAHLPEMTASLVEVGTNQIPDLSTILPNSPTVQQLCFAVEGNTNQQAGATFKPSWSVDAEAATDRASIQTPGWNNRWADHWVRDDLLSGGTLTGAHAFKVKDDATGYGLFGAAMSTWINFTYTKPEPGGTSFVSRAIPFTAIVGKISGIVKTEVEFDVPEEDPSMLQSGIIVTYSTYFYGGVSVKCGAQTDFRAYAAGANGQLGQHALSHRIDSGAQYGSGHTLVRGKNRLAITFSNSFGGDESSRPVGITGTLYLNYTCVTPSTGDLSKSRTCRWLQHPLRLEDPLSGPSEMPTAYARLPYFPAAWQLGAIPHLEVLYYMLGGTDRPASAQIETLSGERPDAGWRDLPMVHTAGTATGGGASIGNFRTPIERTMRRSNDPDSTRIDLGAARKHRVMTGASASVSFSRFATVLVVDLHSQMIATSLTAQRYTVGDGSGITMYVHDQITMELYCTAVTDVGGGFSVDLAPGTYRVFGSNGTDCGSTDNVVVG